MSNSQNRPETSKALLAIAFAGSMLNPQLPALSENVSLPRESFVQQILVGEFASPENKSYALLRLANAYIENRDSEVMQEEFGDQSSRSRFGFSRRQPRGEDILVAWSKRLSLESHNPLSGKTADAKIDDPSMRKVRSQNKALADATLKALMMQIQQSSDKFAQLNMYLIAWRLFERAGDKAGASQCHQILEKSFHACEHGDVKDEREIMGASSVLSSIAYGMVPLDIPDQDPKEIPGFENKNVKSFSEKDVEKAEKLKLRSVAIADQLASTDDTRRKAHRDLALWYAEVSEPKLFEQQKEILFELVGFKNDNLLYAHHIGCGGLVWWVKDLGTTFIDCGRG